MGWAAFVSITDADLNSRKGRIFVFRVLCATLNAAIEAIFQGFHGVEQARFELLPEIINIKARTLGCGRKVDVLGIAWAAVAESQQHSALHNHAGLQKGRARYGDEYGMNGLTKSTVVGILVDPFLDVEFLQLCLLSFFNIDR